MISSRVIITGIIGICILVLGAKLLIVPMVNAPTDTGVVPMEETMPTIPALEETERRIVDVEATNVVEETKTQPVMVKEESLVPIAPTVPTEEAKTVPRVTQYTLAQVAIHNSKASCWTTIGGSVYDITAYVPKHPGGEKKILQVCGKDGSSLFEGQHGGDSKPESRLQTLLIGTLTQ